MNKKNVEPVKRTGSASGFHFINLYQCCPRKFYYRFVLRWRPKHTAIPLILGSAFHEAKAAWYMGKAYKKAFDVGCSVVEESRQELEDPQAYKDILRRLEGLFNGWVEAFGMNDRIEYDVIAVEKELSVPVEGTPFVMTMRPDAVLRNKSMNLPFVFETKTSGFSHRLTAEAVAYGDQATSYLWGVRKIMGITPYAVQTDIAYWNKQSTDLNNRRFIRPELVFRSESRIQEFELSIAQLFTEVTQKVNALKAGFAYAALFPRNSYYCLSYSNPCEYAEICGTPCNARKMPSQFVKDKPAKIGALVADQITIS